MLTPTDLTTNHRAEANRTTEETIEERRRRRGIVPAMLMSLGLWVLIALAVRALLTLF